MGHARRASDRPLIPTLRPFRVEDRVDDPNRVVAGADGQSRFTSRLSIALARARVEGDGKIEEL